MAGKERELLGDWSVSELRAHDDEDELIEEVAAKVDLTTAGVRRRVNAAHGRTLLRNLFEDRWPDRVDEIGELTVAAALEYELEEDIARIVGLTSHTVAKRMEAVHGRSKVAILFQDEWPDRGDAEDDGADEELDDEDEVPSEEGDDDGGYDEDDEDEDVYDDEDEEDDDEEDDDGAYAAVESIAAPTDARRALLTASRLASEATGWGRPLSLRTVMRQLEMHVPERLRSPRFDEVLTRLRGLGLEAAVGRSTQAAAVGGGSPGIAARVRLRILAVRDEAPRQPIRVVPGARPPTATPVTAPRSDYKLALVRLQFLTAIASIDREHSSRWPDDFVAAATRGLRLSEPDQRLLPKVAAQFRRGHHSPTDAAMELVRIGEPDWEGLFASLRELNDESWEAVEHLIEEVSALRAKRLSTPGGATTPPTPPSRKPAPTGPAQDRAAAQPANDRPLGALDDLFK